MNTWIKANSKTISSMFVVPVPAEVMQDFDDRMSAGGMGDWDQHVSRDDMQVALLALLEHQLSGSSRRIAPVLADLDARSDGLPPAPQYVDRDETQQRQYLRTFVRVDLGGVKILSAVKTKMREHGVEIGDKTAQVVHQLLTARVSAIRSQVAQVAGLPPVGRSGRGSAAQRAASAPLRGTLPY
jgi:hypothetical protein